MNNNNNDLLPPELENEIKKTIIMELSNNNNNKTIKEYVDLFNNPPGNQDEHTIKKKYDLLPEDKKKEVDKSNESFKEFIRTGHNSDLIPQNPNRLKKNYLFN